MAFIVSLILAIVLSVGGAISALVPDDNPSEIAQQTGAAVSAIAKGATSSASPLQSGNGNSGGQDNFGSWISEMTPDEPRNDGQVFGETVSTEAKNNGNESEDNDGDEDSDSPPVLLPVEPIEPILPEDLPKCQPDRFYIMIYPPVCVN